MNSKDEIYNRIETALQAAMDTIKLKDRIENDIASVLSIISTLTNDAVSFNISINDFSERVNIAANKIIKIIKKSNPSYGFVLCGYTIDDSSGYPVILETTNTILTCNDDESLKLELTELITEKNISMKIVSLISMDDIPF